MSADRPSWLTRLAHLLLAGLLVAGFGGALAPLAATQVTTTSAVLLNELLVNPPSTDNPYEYVEITGPAGATIAAGIYLVAIEGDGTGAGVADLVVSLGGLTLGSDGLLVVKSPTGGHAIPAGATVVTDAQLDNSGGGIENGSNSYLLIASPTAPVEGTDYDATNDGTPELPSGATILDAVAWTDGDAGDVIYGPALTQSSGTPDAATRFRTNTTASSAAAWYNGDLAGTTNDSLTYSATARSTNFPTGGVLTPGALNAPAGGGNAAIVATCPATLSTITGTAASADVSATDADGTVVSAAITSAAVDGITLTNVVAAASVGGTATATLAVATTTAAGSYPVQITFTNDDATPATTACTVTVTVSAPGLRIRDIQGASHISPLVPTVLDNQVSRGQAVANVPGIVTARTNSSFYLQDPAPDANVATSEGILVFTGAAPAVAVGDSVLVSGTAAEFRTGCTSASCTATSSAWNNLTTTEIVSPTITVLSSGNALPAPIVIGAGGRVPPAGIIDNDTSGSVEVGGQTTFDPAQDGIDFYESLEGMRVQVNNAVAVSPAADFGEIVVVPDNGVGFGPRTVRGGVLIDETVAPRDFNPERIIVDDALIAAEPQVNVGATFSQPIVGVLDYSFANYKLLNTEPLVVGANALTPETARFAHLTPNHLTVATFNVENLDPNDGAARFAAIATAIITNLRAPDLIALEEVQDNNGATNDAVVSAATTYTTLINAIVAAGGPTYSFRQIDPVDDQDGGEPGGNIRVGFLYRTDRGLSFVDRAGGGSTTDTAVQNVGGAPQLQFSPGRLDPTNAAFTTSRKPLAGEFRFNGRTLFVVANHFNSKGGDKPLFGRFQPPTLTSEAQRVQQATIVADFTEAVLAIDPKANVIVLGDLNDFEFSPPLAILEAAGLTSLVETLPKSERYTYVFEGNSQVLDHIMVSANLLTRANAQFDVVHINAEFANPLSDHDPSVARFLLPPVVPYVALAAVANERNINAPAGTRGARGTVAIVGLQANGTPALLTSYDTGKTSAEIPAFTPDQKRLLVTNSDDRTLMVIDTTDPYAPTLLAAVPTPNGGEPSSVAVHPTGGYALVTVIDPAGPLVDGKVYRFNLTTNAFDGASVAVGPNPDAVAISPNGRYALVTNEADDAGAAGGPAGSLSVLTLAGTSLTATTTTIGSFAGNGYPDLNRVEPEYATITPDGRYGVFSIQDPITDTALGVIDLATATITDIKRFTTLAQGGSTLQAEPDGVATWSLNGVTYAATANEEDQSLSIFTISSAGIATLQSTTRIEEFLPVPLDTDPGNSGQPNGLGNTTGTPADDPSFPFDDGEPDPEGIAVTVLGGKPVVIVSLEESGAAVVLDLTNPAAITRLGLLRNLSDDPVEVNPASGTDRKSLTGRPEGVAIAGNPGTVSGIVFRDGNRSGVREPAETGLPSSAVVFVDTNANGQLDAFERSVATSAGDGRYTFAGLAPTRHRLCVTLPGGEAATSPRCTTVGVASGQTTVVDFGAVLLPCPGGVAIATIVGLDPTETPGVQTAERYLRPTTLTRTATTAPWTGTRLQVQQPAGNPVTYVQQGERVSTALLVSGISASQQPNLALRLTYQRSFQEVVEVFAADGTRTTPLAADAGPSTTFSTVDRNGELTIYSPPTNGLGGYQDIFVITKVTATQGLITANAGIAGKVVGGRVVTIGGTCGDPAVSAIFAGPGGEIGTPASVDDVIDRPN